MVLEGLFMKMRGIKTAVYRVNIVIVLLMMMAGCGPI
jgi:hypothetical protein